MKYADLTDEQKAALDERQRKAEAKRQERDVKRAAMLGRLAYAEDSWNDRMRRLESRERNAGRL